MKVLCHVLRQNSGQPPRWAEYPVEVNDGATVLDLLHCVSGKDPSLAYTAHHCKLGICAGCLMVIDGQRRLACRTMVKAAEIRIEPIPGLPVIKDLAVDLLPLSQKGAAAGPEE